MEFISSVSVGPSPKNTPFGGLPCGGMGLLASVLMPALLPADLTCRLLLASGDRILQTIHEGGSFARWGSYDARRVVAATDNTVLQS